MKGPYYGFAKNLEEAKQNFVVQVIPVNVVEMDYIRAFRFDIFYKLPRRFL